ncbi:peptidoglycan recognition protein family protein [Lachnospiraceae bacterium LCP25S3_G4]
MNRKAQLYMRIGIVILVVLMLILGTVRLIRTFSLETYTEKKDEDIDATKPNINVDLLSVNDFSRPGIESDKITGIVVHYTANPGSTAQQNRDYFEGLKDSQITKASSHFVIGLEGEIVQCIPTWEIAYASNERNRNTVSIECCHPDTTGEFTNETYNSCVKLTAWLCQKFGLTEKDVIRHYDVTGKMCPKFYVEHEEEWIQFKEHVKDALEKQ